MGAFVASPRTGRIGRHRAPVALLLVGRRRPDAVPITARPMVATFENRVAAIGVVGKARGWAESEVSARIRRVGAQYRTSSRHHRNRFGLWPVDGPPEVIMFRARQVAFSETWEIGWISASGLRGL
jgi:hypothetical protein